MLLLSLVAGPLRSLRDELNARLAWKVFCDPEHGWVGFCSEDPYERHGLGLPARCRYCKRPMRGRGA